jgi:hypothetical protein
LEVSGGISLPAPTPEWATLVIGMPRTSPFTKEMGTLCQSQRPLTRLVIRFLTTGSQKLYFSLDNPHWTLYTAQVMSELSANSEMPGKGCTHQAQVPFDKFTRQNDRFRTIFSPANGLTARFFCQNPDFMSPASVFALFSKDF